MTDVPVTGIPIFPSGVVKPYTSPKSFLDYLDLSKLEFLYMSSNPISIIPDEIGELDRLERLYIHTCTISSLPQSFGQLSNLKSLWIYNNQLTSLPESFGELNELEKEPNNLLPIVLETIMGKREKVEVFGTDYETDDGSCIRDYVHVTDLADAHLRALDYLKDEKQDLVVNLGTSIGLSVLEVLRIAREVCATEFKYTLAPRRAGAPAVILAKADLAAELLGWKPKHSDARTLLETTLRAYRHRL